MKARLKFASSWDDGNILDLDIAELLSKYGLPGTFYIPGGDIKHPIDALLVYNLNKLGFTIGAHTTSHPSDLKLLSEKEIRSEIVTNKKYLEFLIKKPVNHFCYPRGRFDDRVVKILQEEGFESARTTHVLLAPLEVDPFRIPTAIHVFQRDEYLGVYWFNVAKQMAQAAANCGSIFHIWGHSWEVFRDNNFEELEEFFKWLTENFDIERG